MKRIYLDYTATTPVDRRVAEAMAPYLFDNFGNASSIHSFGRDAKYALEDSRERIARLTGTKTSEIFFTSGGTEADNAAVLGVGASGTSRKGIVISAIEHHAVLHTADSLKRHGFDVRVVAVDHRGIVDLDDYLKALGDDTLLVSIIHTNNETGTIQDIPALCRMAHGRGALFHTDAVQAFGKTELDLQQSGVDLASLTAHKIYGPKGIGALYVRRGTDIQPIMHGGAQERNRRPGTESVFLAVGFAEAASLAASELDSERSRLTSLNSTMRKRISSDVPGVVYNSDPEISIPNILSVSIDSREMEIDGEALIVNMDLEGISVTSGSACSSGSLQPSHVIKALGRDNLTTMATVRFSFGRFTTEEDIANASGIFSKVVRRIGKRKRITLPA